MTDDTDIRQEPAEAATETAGQRLRAARERAGWNQERLAGELGIPMQRLRALEADEYAGFGGEVFVRGFLRRAAVVLGLPPGELVEAYAATVGARHPAEIMPELPPGRPPRAGLPGWAGPAAGAVMVALVLATTWWTLRPAGEPESPPLADVPAALPEAPPASLPAAAPAATADTAAAAETEQVAAALPQDPDPAEPAAAETDAGALAATGPASTEPAAADSAADEALAVVAEQAPALPEPAFDLPVTAELRFEFSDDCWVEVTDAREQRLAYRLFRAGDVARMSGVPPLAVFLGNAEGVRLTVDGEPVAVRPAATRNGTARLTVGGGTG